MTQPTPERSGNVIMVEMKTLPVRTLAADFACVRARPRRQDFYLNPLVPLRDRSQSIYVRLAMRPARRRHSVCVALFESVLVSPGAPDANSSRHPPLGQMSTLARTSGVVPQSASSQGVFPRQDFCPHATSLSGRITRACRRLRWWCPGSSRQRQTRQ